MSDLEDWSQSEEDAIGDARWVGMGRTGHIAICQAQGLHCIFWVEGREDFIRAEQESSVLLQECLLFLDAKSARPFGN